MIDLDGFVIPACIDLDHAAGEIDGVFQNVADAIEDGRITRADRLVSEGNRDPYLDRHIETAMRRNGFLDQRRQRHAIERRAGCR